MFVITIKDHPQGVYSVLDADDDCIIPIFVNKNDATFNDMKKLIDFVKHEVKEKTGINLDLEIEIVG